jgi:MoaA/NifB/PqqE/SkfB family radical SAM enzyme
VSAAAPVTLDAPSSTAGLRTRRCPCGASVSHQMSGREALERETCPSCAREVLFTSYVRMDIALSEYCNLTCQMCRRPSEARFMDKEVCKRALDEARLVGVETVSFSGGEPFVHPAIEELLAHAFSLGIKVQLVTNGTLIKRDKLDFLSQLDCMTVSLDGLEDAHDFIRQRQGTWRRTERTIRWLAETRIQWGTNTVMQRHNAHQLYDLFKHIQGIGGKRYAYCGFSHVEVVPETADLQMTPEQEKSAYEQLVRIERACAETGTWFNQKEQLLHHFELYSRKQRRYRPFEGCKIPQKFIGFSDHGFYLCWHQGRNIQSDSLVAALGTDLARDIVREGLEKRCVACNSFNYAWDDEWNAGMMKSALRGENVESGVIALRVPVRDAKRDTRGPSRGNTIDMHDDG